MKDEKSQVYIDRSIQQAPSYLEFNHPYYKKETIYFYSYTNFLQGSDRGQGSMSCLCPILSRMGCLTEHLSILTLTS